MITKTGDFREGESRCDVDMTKVARSFDEQGFAIEKQAPVENTEKDDKSERK